MFLGKNIGKVGVASIAGVAGIAGVATIQLCGILNLLLGAGLSRWTESLPELLFSYSLGPLLAQLALCVAISLIALPIRRLLWIE